MLATLLRPTPARADRLRRRPRRAAVRSLIGVTGQYASVDETLSAPRTSCSSAACSGLSAPRRKVNAPTSSSEFASTDAGDKPSRSYSGGMRRRLDLAASLIAPAAADLPRRADHRPRPAHPRPDVGHHPRPGRRRAAPCCSPPSTSTRPTSSPTGSPSSTTAAWSPRAPPTSSRPRSAARPSSCGWPTRHDPAPPRRRAPGLRRGAGLTPEAGGINVPLPTPRPSPTCSSAPRARRAPSPPSSVHKPTLDEVFLALTGHAPTDGAPEPSTDDSPRPRLEVTA